jgi:hypothetical protein
MRSRLCLAVGVVAPYFPDTSPTFFAVDLLAMNSRGER